MLPFHHSNNGLNIITLLYSAPRARAVRAGQQLRGARRVAAAAVRAGAPPPSRAAPRLLRRLQVDLVRITSLILINITLHHSYYITNHIQHNVLLN